MAFTGRAGAYAASSSTRADRRKKKGQGVREGRACTGG